MITHEMAVVKDICDRVAIMEQGRVVEEGDTVSVFSHPKEAMTKDFIDTASNLGKIHDLIAEGHSTLPPPVFFLYHGKVSGYKFP